MIRRCALLLLPSILVVSACSTESERAWDYPESPTVGVVDDYHGTPVPDPYRWLEDLDSPETAGWVAAQNALTRAYLEEIPERDAIRERLTALWDHPRMGAPRPAGDRIVYFANDGLQNQDVLYIAESPDDPPQVLLDPNLLSDDGTVALTGIEVSPDGRYLAYGTASGGSDWQEWHILDIDRREPLPDRLRWIKFNQPAWSTDSDGLYYARYPAPSEDAKLEQTNRDQSAWYHRLGSAQSEDVEVFQPPENAGWILQLETSEDGRHVILVAQRGSDRTSAVLIRPAEVLDAPFRQLAGAFEARYSLVGSRDDVLWLRTDLDAPNGRLVAAPVDAESTASWTTLIGESEDVLESVEVVGTSFVATSLHDAASRLSVHDLDGSLRGQVELGLLGTVNDGPRGSSRSPIGWFGMVSFTSPARIYQLDTTNATARLVRAPEVSFDPDDFVTEQVFYTSADGTRIPMFLSHRADVTPTGDVPVILFGYGGFNASYTPRFRVPHIVWMERGGLLAVPNLRGGGEYGRAWHDAGRLANKQNTFDDFIAAGEFLIDQGWTDSDRLSLYGGSNGGLLVGAVVNQRPDLAAAAVPVVGVMDMLRFHEFTIGWAWVSDYGSPEDPEMFPVLHAYSPYHNITPGTRYPAVMAITADHDDRVVPSHSFKYIARLQAAQAADDPILIRIETRAGHGAGKPVTKQIAQAADRLAFLERELGMSDAG